MAETEAGKGGVTIIKRIKKGGHGHHGGAWKVAYADFVTAMMAFFLLLWLLNSVTEQQMQGISNYFAPTTVSQSPSGAGGALGGKVIGQGAAESNSGQPTPQINLPPSTVGQGGQDFTDAKEGRSDQDKEGLAEKDGQGGSRDAQKKQEEAKTVQQISAELQQALNANPLMKQLQGNLLVDNTPEGLRIQVMDSQGEPMFQNGSSAMYERTKQLLTLVGRIAKEFPQKIAIDGHTDADQLTDPNGYGNWELSADRALAARRVMLAAGYPEAKIGRVSGRAGNDPIDASKPDDPRNRRITIILLRESEVAGTSASPPTAPPLGSVLDQGKP